MQARLAGFALQVADGLDDFQRIAVVTDSQWVTWSAWLSQTFVAADVEVFGNTDEAQAWLAAEAAV